MDVAARVRDAAKIVLRPFEVTERLLEPGECPARIRVEVSLLLGEGLVRTGRQDIDALDGSQVEIFKLRDRNDNVVGIATRVSSVSDSSGPFIQWMLHLPARGTVFARMGLGTTVEGVRDGLLVAGTREFETLNGYVREYFNNDVPQDDREISGREITGR